jgi:hypothetical protein
MLPMDNGLETVAKGATSSRMRSTSPGVERMYRSCQ